MLLSAGRVFLSGLLKHCCLLSNVLSALSMSLLSSNLLLFDLHKLAKWFFFSPWQTPNFISWTKIINCYCLFVSYTALSTLHFCSCRSPPTCNCVFCSSVEQLSEVGHTSIHHFYFPSDSLDFTDWLQMWPFDTDIKPSKVLQVVVLVKSI